MTSVAWLEKRIAELGRIVTGTTPPSSRPECFADGEGFPFITPSDMWAGRKANSPGRFLSKEGAALLRTRLLPPGSVAVSCIGWQMGRSVMTSRPSFTNQQLNAIVPHQGVDGEFLYYALRTRQEELLSLGSATGVRTPIINKSAFGNLTLLVPSIGIQKRIASILSVYDELIDNNLRRMKILEEMAQSLYREWFVDFRFPGHENGKMVNSPLGMIPEGWETKNLSSLAVEVRDGTHPDSWDAGTCYVGLEHIPRRSLALTEWGAIEDVSSSKLVFRKGDILFGKIRPYFHKVVIAPIDGLCSTDAIVIRAKDPSQLSLVAGVVSSVKFVEHATATSQGTKMPRADWKVLKQYPVAFATEATLRSYQDLASPLLQLMDRIVFQNRNLRSTRDLLLPELISGELDVSELDIDVGENAA